MRSAIFAAAIIIAASVFGVRHWEANTPPTAAPERASNVYAAGAAKPNRSSSNYRSGRRDEVRIPAARDHQFYVTAAVNKSPAPFLVDTGASFVALRESDARRAGLRPYRADFDQPVRTANGVTNAARVTLRAIEINGIKVENVEAFILADDQLGVNLLGMSFLSRLESVESRAGELVLRG